MEKIYAKTINPEYYDYRLYIDIITENDNFIINGGRHFQNFNDIVLKDIENLYNDYKCLSFEYYFKEYYNNSYKAYFRDMLRIKDMNNFETNKIKKCLDNDNLNELMLVCLEIIKGKPYRKYQLKGTCQGDIVDLYAPKETNIDTIRYIECVYWGTGTEIMIHDYDTEIENPNDIDGYTFYTECYNVDDIKQVIRDNTGCNRDTEIVLWTYTGTKTIRIDQYEKV